MSERTVFSEAAWFRCSGALVGLAVLVTAPLLIHLTAAVQLDYSEGWNVIRQEKVAEGVALYAEPPGLDETNYPPLSFHLVAVLHRFLGGDINLAGRIVSLLSLVALGGLAGWLVAQLTRSRAAGFSGAAIFLAAFSLWMPTRVAENDPQLPGMALELLGFCLALRYGGSGAGLWASAPLFALAVFFKPNLIAVPLGVGTGLLCECAWPRLILWGGIGLAVSSALYVFSVQVDGPYFHTHLLWPRAYNFQGASSQGGVFLITWSPLIFLSGLFILRHHQTLNERMLGSAWLAALVLNYGFAGGDGVSQNIFFEALWLNAVMSIVALAELSDIWPKSWGRRSFALLALSSLLPLRLLPERVIDAVNSPHLTRLGAAEFAQGVDVLRTAPSPVVCENLLMCFNAGRASYFDPFFLGDQVKIDRMPADFMTSLVSAGTLGTVEIGDTDRPMQPRHRYDRFEPAFFAALAAHYQIVLQTPTVSIWERKTTP